MEQVKRSAICELRRAGHSPAFIAKSLQYPRQTVYDVCKRFDESGQDQRAAHKPRSDKIRKPRFLAGLKRSVKANPTVSFSTLAKKRAVSITTIHRGIKELGLTSYAQGKRHLLTNRMKEVRLERCRKVLNWLKSNGSAIKFFSDEKIFTVDRAFNRRNDRWIASSSTDVHPTMTTKKPASVMALCVVSSEGDVFTHFFANREKVNAEVYCNVLDAKIIPWMKAKASGKKFVFQQDSAPAHTARKTVDLLKRSGVRFWEKDFWPSNSPDLNPLDYFFGRESRLRLVQSLTTASRPSRRTSRRLWGRWKRQRSPAPCPTFASV
jgi:hypothetical protein